MIITFFPPKAMQNDKVPNTFKAYFDTQPNQSDLEELKDKVSQLLNIVKRKRPLLLLEVDMDQAKADEEGYTVDIRVFVDSIQAKKGEWVKTKIIDKFVEIKNPQPNDKTPPSQHFNQFVFIGNDIWKAL